MNAVTLASAAFKGPDTGPDLPTARFDDEDSSLRSPLKDLVGLAPPLLISPATRILCSPSLLSVHARRAEERPLDSTASTVQHQGSGNPCFAEAAQVKLTCNRTVPVRDLRSGSQVLTPLGPRRVEAVLKTQVYSEMLRRVGGLLVTPWHPVFVEDTRAWAFPAELETPEVLYTGCVYSLLLEPDGFADAHAVHMDGVWCVTLGHGVVTVDDARAHPFFSNFEAIRKSFASLSLCSQGLVIGGGIMRDDETGLVAGFRRCAGPA